MSTTQEQGNPPQIGDMNRWDGERWERLPGPAAVHEGHQAFTAVYGLLASMEALDKIETAEITIPRPAEVWQQAIKQAFHVYNQMEDLMERWGEDLNSATIREQNAQSEHQP
jgi:hypothetical protein